MGQLVKIDIAGKSYPLNFSLKASKAIMIKYGSWEGLSEAFEEKPEQAVDMLLWLLEMLINEGYKYNCLVNGEEKYQINADDLETILNMSELKGIQETIMIAMNPEREVKTFDKNSGNVATTQTK